MRFVSNQPLTRHKTFSFDFLCIVETMKFQNILLLPLLSSLAYAQNSCTADGEVVEAEGYIMDILCIERGTLLDAPDIVTLQNPEKHSIHCLVDVDECVDSGYSILSPPKEPGLNYTVKYLLGPDGTKQAKQAAENARNNGQVEGFRATVRGIDVGASMLRCVEIQESSRNSFNAGQISALLPTKTTLLAPLLGIVYLLIE